MYTEPLHQCLHQSVKHCETVATSALDFGFYLSTKICLKVTRSFCVITGFTVRLNNSMCDRKVVISTHLAKNIDFYIRVTFVFSDETFYSDTQSCSERGLHHYSESNQIKQCICLGKRKDSVSVFTAC